MPQTLLVRCSLSVPALFENYAAQNIIIQRGKYCAAYLNVLVAAAPGYSGCDVGGGSGGSLS